MAVASSTATPGPIMPWWMQARDHNAQQVTPGRFLHPHAPVAHRVLQKKGVVVFAIDALQPALQTGDPTRLVRTCAPIRDAPTGGATASPAAGTGTTTSWYSVCGRNPRRE